MIQDLAHTMFFKASFDIEARPKQDALWSLVLEIRRWLQSKSKRNNFMLSWDIPVWTQLKKGDSIKSEDGNVSLFSSLHVNNNIYTWACKLTENQGIDNALAPRQWITEIGFLGKSLERGTVSIVLSYQDRPGFIGPLQAEPNPTIPGIVKSLLRNENLVCSVSGIQLPNSEVLIEDARSTFELITNPKRAIPVILITPNYSGNFNISPNELHKMLGPNALILYTDNPSIIEELNSYLEPYNLSCFRGSLRVYDNYLDIAEPNDSTRHRYISSKTIGDFGPEATLQILRRALAQDVHFWQSMLRIEDIKRLNRKSSRDKREEELRNRYQDEALEEILEINQEKENAELLAEQALEENAQLSEENYNLKMRCNNYEQAFANTNTGMNSNSEKLYQYMMTLEKFPSSPIEIANLAKHVFYDCIDFSERGWQSLDDCKTANDVLWQAFFDISTILHPLFKSNESTNIVKTFGDRSRFEYAKGEGPLTHRNQKLMAQRIDIYQGREINIEPHISSKTGDPSSPRFLRVYLAWDEQTKKIIIGECGRHMTNHISRSLH